MYSEEYYWFVVNSLSEGIFVILCEGVVIVSNLSVNWMMCVKGEFVGCWLLMVILCKLCEDGMLIELCDWLSWCVFEMVMLMFDYMVGFGFVDGDIIWVCGNVVLIVWLGEMWVDLVFVLFNDIGFVCEV